jgi:Thrombospondin type 3 repeat
VYDWSQKRPFLKRKHLISLHGIKAFMKLTILSILSVVSIVVLIALTFSFAANTNSVQASAFLDSAHSAESSPTPTPIPKEENKDVQRHKNTQEEEMTAEQALNGGLGSEDFDCDGIINVKDNCMLVYNPDQKNSDGDGQGDACDADLTDPNRVDSRCDSDNDGVYDRNDNCPLVFNPNQKDKNKNGIGDVCEQKPVKKVKDKKPTVKDLKRRKNR